MLKKKKINKNIKEDNTSIFNSLETVLENTEGRNITTETTLIGQIPVKNKCLFNKFFLFVDDSTKKSDQNQTPDSESANDNTLEPIMLMD